MSAETFNTASGFNCQTTRGSHREKSLDHTSRTFAPVWRSQSSCATNSSQTHGSTGNCVADRWAPPSWALGKEVHGNRPDNVVLNEHACSGGGMRGSGVYFQ